MGDPAMTTLIVLGVIVGLLLFVVVASAWLLVLGARLARIPQIGFKRALAAVLLYTVVGIAAQGIVLSIGGDRYPIAGLAVALGVLVVTWKIVQWVFRTSLGRAVLAWLPTLLIIPATLLIIWFLIQPFVLEGYSTPTNSMAPTIVGDHLETKCPRCGGKLFVSAAEPSVPRDEDLGICSQCLQTSIVKVPPGEPQTGDRMIALKCLRPSRWDLVVFRLPEDPSVIYVRRLIGLPGEEIAIRDGEVWINGRLEEKPAEISGLRYWGKEDLRLPAGRMNDPPTDWGPVTLGDGEYFVLGDFSRRAADARYWRVGAPGHPPYAVPESHLVGVVTHIYWPPPRWRVFR
jgi:signal peptidase I